MRRKIPLFILIFLPLLSFSVEACSITSSGRCGGSECENGKSCKKIDDFSCDCVNSDDNILDQALAHDATRGHEIAGNLSPGEPYTVYVGAVAKSFDVRLLAPVAPQNKVTVKVDGKVATTLSASARAAIINSKKITLILSGTTNQVFRARLID